MADEDKIVVNFNHFVNQSEPYFAQGVFEPNLQNEDLVAFSFDINGAEKFSLVVIDVRTRRNSPGIPSTYYSARWGAGTDASCIYYNVVDPVWGTPRKVYQYCLTENSMETLQGAESLVYVEEDVTLTTEVSATTDGRYTYIQVAGQATSEVLLLRTAEGSHASVHPVFRRVQETQYHIDHYNGSFFVLTNADQALNYRILRVNVETAITSIPNAITGMEPVICHRVDETIEKLEILEDHLVAWVRKDGLRRFRTLDLTSLRSGCADAPLGYDISESAIPYSLFPGITFDMDSRLYRRFASKNFVYSNSSFASPSRSWLYDLEAGTSSLLSEQRVAGLGHYTERRVWATSSMESTIKVPISLIHASNRTGPQALLLSAYGAYGTYTDPTFATRILPLLDRGITYAMCHPRGDGNMGASWYLDGKYASKKHTFEDVETCLKGLIDQGYTAPGRVAVCGRSAGGLITGDVVNRLGWQPGLDSAAHPDAMVKAVVAQVPFIDPIGDMTDETIPWTPYEYYEWGNPLTNNTIFEAMREYSPYGNISPNRTFPQLFVSAGLQDGRVGFFEPAKWVAKLRTAFKKEDQHNLVLRVRNSGHFGGGDYAETAEWLAFVINAVA
ncbi:hypothetical protein HKX48_005946 [Thoreauomyces humboldtii]|nr:hypothetical protein HKX48_005946 [Thoreauomyces humboldtii]